MKSTKAYTVGYRRPPRHTRFKKGQSGNPKGAAKGRKNMRSELDQMLAEQVMVVENGRERTLSTQTVLLKRLIADAVQGKGKAREQLLRLMLPIDEAHQQSGMNAPAADEDREILARFRARLVEEITAHKTSR